MSRTVFGIQPVREVLRAHGEHARVWLAQPSSPKLAGLERLATSRGASLSWVRRDELDRRTKGGMHQGALAEAPELVLLDHDRFMKSVLAEPHPTAMLLDGIMDPQNFGAVVRAAVAQGVPHLVWPEHGSAPLTPATFRASAGAIEHARLTRVPSLIPVIQDLRARDFTVVLLDGSGELPLDQVDLRGRVAVVLGAEDRGAKPAVRRAASVRAHIPMAGVIDSLNASVAAAVALYEVARQRRHAGASGEDDSGAIINS